MTNLGDGHDRRKWARFGICAELGRSEEPSVTSIAKDEIFIEWVHHEDDDGGDDACSEEGATKVDRTPDFKKLAARQVKAQLKSERLHLRLEERKKGLRPTRASDTFDTSSHEVAKPSLIRDLARRSQTETSSSSSRKERYVPPALRVGCTSKTSYEQLPAERERYSGEVKIGNLSVNAAEADVEELCRTFGPVKRVYMKRNRRTGENQGVAYVTFERPIHAEKCIRLLNGYGYDHLILSVAWPTNSR